VSESARRRKPLVYVAGPYTNPDPVENTRIAVLAGMEIADSGLAAVEIPHLTLFAHFLAPRGIDYWYQFDLDKLAHCDYLLRLPGASSGADKEVDFAIELKINIYNSMEALFERLRFDAL
jgi:hypothetical protein